jgi:hypothetical protein
VFFFQLQARCVITGIGQIPEPIHQTQNEQDHGVDSQGDGGVSLFNPVQRGPAD